MSAADGFQFTEERPRPTADALVVRVPARLNRKRRVLAAFAGPLQFPDYFGWNWDAFEECLSDLSWLNGIREVIIVHRDAPFAAAPAQRAIYLSILQERVRQCKEPRCTVTFPPGYRPEVMQSLTGD